MSNYTKETLHELIKYMSKSEKRYFKVLSSRHTIGEENNYILLFDFIESQEEYNEEAIFSHFKGEAFLNKFSITKKRLYDHLISALDNFHSSNSPDAQIYKLLNSADILYQKSLYHQSLKQLKSAEKIAVKNHKYNLLSEINLKVKRIYESQGNLDSNEINKLLLQDEEYHQKSLTYDKFWNLKSKLFSLLSSKGISRSEEDLIEFKKIIEKLLESSKKSELYFDSHYLYNHIYSAYYFATNSFEDCYIYLTANIELMENTEDVLQDQVNRYLSVLTNAIYVASRLSKKDDLLILQKKLKSLSLIEKHKNNEDFQIKLFSSIYSIELTTLCIQGKIQEALQLIPLIESGMMLYAEKITEIRKAFLQFKIASVYFLTGEFHTALKWLNKILNDSTIDNQEDIVSFSHLLSLLIHFEMKNDDFIPYVLKNTQRYLKSRNRIYEFETNFLKFVTKMCKISNEIQREELWNELYTKLISYEDPNLKRVAFEYFDFITWAESKSQRKSYQSLVKDKVTLS
ncbi:MAG: hypothetical protein V4622_08055 [Bacteroidota bacterium]